jgi:hypothetical protein
MKREITPALFGTPGLQFRETVDLRFEPATEFIPKWRSPPLNNSRCHSGSQAHYSPTSLILNTPEARALITCCQYSMKQQNVKTAALHG